MTPPTPPGAVTQLLADQADAPDLVDQLVPLVYDELREVAHRHLRRNAAPTIRTTELVHEAYDRLASSSQAPTSSRAHFFGAASRAMRQVLVDRARARQAQKRPQNRVSVDFGRFNASLADDRADEILAIHDALDRLAQVDERTARVVECRFFGGLSVEETAQTLDISPRTVKRDWQDARTWLFRELRADA
ncbi:MAG: ECF-type sigma factor [Rubricoccaceae bacterium]